MAYCEKCNTKGFHPSVMVGDPLNNKLIGPCCYEAVKTVEAQVVSTEVLPPRSEENEFGLALSSKFGVLAHGQFGGLQFEYRRTAEEMPEWFQQARFPDHSRSQPMLESTAVVIH